METALTLAASRLREAQKLVRRFARSAAKAGIPGPTMEVSREWREYTVRDGEGVLVLTTDDADAASEALAKSDAARRRGIGRGEILFADRVDVRITGERPIVQGWEFVATLAHEDGGNLIKAVPGAGPIPKRFRDAGPQWCDHCQTKRRRNNTFVVRDSRPMALRPGEEREHKQVGRSCLQCFLGDASPAAWMQAFKLDKALRELSAHGGRCWTPAPLVRRKDFLGAAAHLVRRYGYVSRARAQTSGLTTTASEAWGGLSHSDHEVRQAARAAITDQDLGLASEALEWLGAQSDESDYMYNLRRCASHEVVSAKHVGYLASLIQTYLRAQGRLAQHADRANEHLPGVAIKDRITLELTVIKIVHWDTDYGTTALITFEDAGGRCVIWRTSSDSFEGRAGAKVSVRGTVKGFGEYNGRKQTILTRCKVSAIDIEAVAA